MSDFVRSKDLNIATAISTGLHPLSRYSDIEIKGDPDGICVRTEVLVDDDILSAGVSITIEADMELYADVFCGRNHMIFTMSDGKWLYDDPAVKQLQETNRQLVAENERRSAEIASLKSQRPEPLLNEQFSNLILKAQKQGVTLKYFDGIAWQSVDAAPYIEQRHS